MVKSRGKPCEASLYTMHDTTPTDHRYHLFRKDANHTHENATNKVTAIPDNVKELIKSYVDDGLTTVKIVHRLRLKTDIKQPDRGLVNNFIKTYKKTQFGDSKVYLEDMIEYCEMYKQSDDLHIDEAFILAYDHSPLTTESDTSAAESDSDGS